MATYRMNVEVAHSAGSGPSLNTWHFRDTALPGDLDVIPELIHTFYDTVKGIYQTSTTVSFSGELIEDPYGSPEYATVPSWSVTGTGIGNALPPANQIVVGWRTQSATRAGRGRTFLGPLASLVQQSNGAIETSWRALILAAANDLVAASEALATGAVVVYSRTQGVARDITAASMSNQFAVLRSRRD